MDDLRGQTWRDGGRGGEREAEGKRACTGIWGGHKERDGVANRKVMEL